MKKVLTLPIFALAALVSQAQAEVCTGTNGATACQWDTGCFTISTEYSYTSTCKGSVEGGNPSHPVCTCEQLIKNCTDYGALYSGVTGLDAAPYGAGWKCIEHGGKYQGGKSDPKASGKK
ncbi:MAG: hypothetical protein LBC64_11590 [Fibromonadaceae bacterium]|jgi:hypothetical protein|nr:hypothetical protein [Fibromonadaceae bacterium]